MNNENLGDRGDTLLMATETGHIHVGLIWRMSQSEGNMKIQVVRKIIYIDYFMVGERVRFLFTSCEESQTNE